LNAILELPFITIMAAMIAIFCRLAEVGLCGEQRAKFVIFERKTGALQRILTVNQNPGPYRSRPPFFELKTLKIAPRGFQRFFMFRRRDREKIVKNFLLKAPAAIGGTGRR